MSKYEPNNILDIAEDIADTVSAKNHDYDRAFEKSFDEYGWPTYFIRLGDKVNRLKALTIKNEEILVNESVEDTLQDIVGYTLLLLEIIKRNKEEETNE